MRTTTHTRTARPDKIDEIPGRYDVADGGVYIQIGDQAIAITSRSEDPDAMHESLLRSRRVVQNLLDGSRDALAEIDAAIVDLGTECATCGGARGQAVAGPREWEDCPTCFGKGRTPINPSSAVAA
jgi:hypothetical protein